MAEGAVKRGTPARWRGWFMAAGLAAALGLAFSAVFLSPFDMDEFEFARASSFVAEGRLPYAGFWEHHTPLLWLVAAPVAGPALRADPVVGLTVLRGLAALFWLATAWIGLALLRRRGVPWLVGGLALALLFAQDTFLRTVVQFRVDSLMVLLVLGGLMACDVGCEAGSVRWLGLAGLCLALACLASQRALFFAVAAVLWAMAAALWKRRAPWRFALPLAGAGGAVAAAVAALLLATGTFGLFWRDVVTLNWLYEKSEGAFGGLKIWWPVLLEPLRQGSPGALLFWGAVLASLVAAFLPSRLRGPLIRPLALVWLGCAAASSLVAATFGYQFLALWWLGGLLVALAVNRWALLSQALERPLAAGVALLVVLACLGVAAAGQPWKEWGTARDRQVWLLEEVAARTRPGQVVWEGSGCAFGRKPASTYWFTPTLVTALEKRGLLSVFDPARLRAEPPALVLMDGRFSPALDAAPAEVRAFLYAHYLPVTRRLDLWAPAAVKLLQPSSPPLEFAPPLPGQYRLAVLPLEPDEAPWFASGTLDEIRSARPIPSLPEPPGLVLATSAKAGTNEGGGPTYEFRRGDWVRASWLGSHPAILLLVPTGYDFVYVPVWGAEAKGSIGKP